jgi:D-glucosaminate-6-phosphate ammonia-lyase
MPLDPEVTEAMAQAGSESARFEDVQRAAGVYLAKISGAEAGYVTSGAAAGLVVSAAACIARYSPAAMDQLPDTTGLRNEIIVQRAHVTAYTHALRVSGATLVEVGYVGYPGQGITWPWQVEAAISERTAAIFFSVGSAQGVVSLPELAEIGDRYEIPVIVDAASALPPRENLKRFIRDGASLVNFSGGKAIGGPQASGILVGRQDLIESVALQHQDMDVFPRTWTWRQQYLESHRLPGPPHHGLGRPMKVGKEEIAGLVVALDRFLSMDLGAELTRQGNELSEIASVVEEHTTAKTEIIPDGFQRLETYPTLLVYPQLENDSTDQIFTLINRLDEGDPPVAVSQNFIHLGAIGIRASTLRSNQFRTVAEKLREALCEPL